MRTVLVVTDGVGDQAKIAEQSLKNDSHAYETVHADKYAGTLEKEWKAIVLVFDSVSAGLRVAEQFSKTIKQQDTPLVYHHPTPMAIRNLSMVQPLGHIGNAVTSVLRTRAELKKSA